MLVVYLIYEIMYIFLSLAIVQGGLQAMVTRGAYSLIWPIRGCAAGQSMVFVLSVLDRDYDFVRVCPIYKHGCTIYLIGLVNFVCIPSLYKGNHSKVFALLQLPIKWS